MDSANWLTAQTAELVKKRKNLYNTSTSHLLPPYVLYKCTLRPVPCFMPIEKSVYFFSLQVYCREKKYTSLIFRAEHLRV